nr:alcohol dehydrogenase catalytic domain-containing protein [Dictyobacter vulcani]
MSVIHAWAAHGPKQDLVPYEYEAGELGPDEVEIAVEYSGLCHSDISVLNNDWGNSVYPFVPGHEVIGRVVARGADSKGLTLGQRVGIGWTAASCMHCQQCLSGNQHLCAEALPTIIGHYGGFADRVRAQWDWAIPIPEDWTRARWPLLCGGVTVFSPLYTFDIRPTQRVGVVGIGGLGHMAFNSPMLGVRGHSIDFERSKIRGCEGAWSTSCGLSAETADAIQSLAGSLDLLLVTVNVSLDWSALIATWPLEDVYILSASCPRRFPLPSSI